MRGGQPVSFEPRPLRTQFSPHARGSTRRTIGTVLVLVILPACAGVNPAPPVLSKGISDSPRMRGGHPNFGCWKSKNTQFTPHARGSTQQRQFSLFPCNGIHPACAGVTLSREWLYEPVYSPRVRGGQPDLVIDAYATFGFSPHARGSPFLSIGLSMVLVFTPHARGSTLPQIAYYVVTRIHPACAGINPDNSGSIQNQKDSPRMRGGQPDFVVDAYTTLFFPLHMQGCSFFTTQKCLEEIT